MHLHKVFSLGFFILTNIVFFPHIADQKLHDGETIKIQANIDAVNENIAEFNSNSESILKANVNFNPNHTLNYISKIYFTKYICI